MATKSITWDEVKEHNKHDDCWMVIHGDVYDVSKWIPRHPGGNIITLGGGRDCTVQFECYHPDRTKVGEALMKKYRIGKIAESTHPFDWSSPFYTTLKQRVLEVTAKSGMPRRGPLSMYLKTFLIMTGWVLSWYLGMVKGWWTGAALFGFFSSQIGVSVMHDGSHGAYSENAWVNSIAAFGMDLIGACTITWEFQHIVGHHPYTNLTSDTSRDTDENDPDVFSSFPMIVMHPVDAKRRFWYNKYQHIYAPLLFALFTMAKTLKDDFKCVLTGKVSHISMENRLSNQAYHIRFWIMKVLTISYMFLLPAYLHGPLKGFGLLATAHIVCGEFLALMFIVTHVTEGASMVGQDHTPSTTAQQAMWVKKAAKEAGVTKVKSVPDMDWAAIQCRTSVNWACDSFLWTHVSGGLNHQIEHHLFPGICHMHYQAMRPVVKQTCAEFGVPYIEHSTLSSAIESMLRYLYLVGNGHLSAE